MDPLARVVQIHVPINGRKRYTYLCLGEPWIFFSMIGLIVSSIVSYEKEIHILWYTRWCDVMEWMFLYHVVEQLFENLILLLMIQKVRAHRRHWKKKQVVDSKQNNNYSVILWFEYICKRSGTKTISRLIQKNTEVRNEWKKEAQRIVFHFHKIGRFCYY